MSDFVDKCVSVHKNLAKIPSLTNFIATECKGAASRVEYEAVWAQRDLNRNAKFSYKTTGLICNSSMKVFSNQACTETNGELIVRVSNNGTQRAILREVKIKEVRTQFIEIWHGPKRISATNLTSENKHGVVHSNGSFCCLEWSHNDETLLYVAERKKSKSESYFKNSGNNDNCVKKGEEYVYQEEWGEQLVGCSHPIVVMFDVKSEAITPLEESLPDEMCAGEVIWGKGDKSIVILGWKVTPWRLGLVYCKNRPSALYKFDLENKESVPLTDAESCVFSPRLTPDGLSVIYLQNRNFGPHQQCAKMLIVDLTNKAKKVVVDEVLNPESSNDFQGLYMDSMSKNCWIGNKIVLSSTHRSNTALLAIDINSGKVQILESKESWHILSICNCLIFACHSSPNSSDSIKFGLVSDAQIQWNTLEGPSFEFPEMKWEIIKYKPRLENKKFPDLDFESVLIKPAHEEVKGLIANPHSGPHMCHTASFNMFSVGFCQLGYAVLHINFRGSLGFGQNNVNSLPTNISVQDVSDVQQSVESTIELLKNPSIDVFIHGSSHGGSLTIQMLGQFPDFYSAGVTSNPAANIASMIGVSDIPDWCFCEAGLQFSFQTMSAEYDYSKWMEFSPVKHIAKIKAPLLMLVGGADIRVPPSQSIESYRCRKALGGVVKMLFYPNNDHPIAEVLAEADSFVNMAMWFYHKGEAK
uniref:Acylamino-acid-releasing enzyme n=1 Tax=Phallusia mammillata TaxID=59560 RepID=A0A6F9D7D8_9ASCI|nr:acylamino-acid-releasing enzyme-like [Phallusia mammillata]